MAKLRKLRETELVGGTSNEDLYPITVASGVIDKSGNNLQEYLTEILRTYLFGGVVGINDAPLDNKLTKLFYLGLEPGIYKNFNNFENRTNEICLFIQNKQDLIAYHININSSNLPIATDDVLGGIKTGYKQFHNQYPVKVDSNGRAYVYVPGGTIPDIPVTGISFNKTQVTLKEGDTENIIVIITPADATNKNVTWKSSDSSICTVSAQSDGALITGITSGTAEISAITEDGEFEAKCNVQVLETVQEPNKSYFGAVADDFVANEQNIKENTEELNLSSKNYTATVEMDYQKTLYAYPKKYGALDSIKDANGFEYLLSYTRSELLINGEQYYVYLLTDAATIPMFKQVYS